MTDPFKPIPYTDHLGRKRVIVEVTGSPPAVRQVVKHHVHTVRWDGKEHRVPHTHVVDLNAPEHIHSPEEPDVA